MKRLTSFAAVVIGLAALQACGGEGTEQEAVADAAPQQVSTPEVTLESKSKHDGKVSSPVAPFSMAYRVIGTPVVGVPVAIEVSVDSKLVTEPVNISYAINDTTALQFPAAQPANISALPDARREPIVQQLSVVPQREGRHYVNVTASIETADGSQSLVMAVPVQVGSGGPELEKVGESAVDADGNRVQVMKGEGG